MNKFLLLVVCLYILLLPLYIFESGLPQPAHYILAIGLIMGFFSLEFRKTIFTQKPTRYLVAFIVVVIIVNTSYFAFLTFTGIENSLYLPIAYYIFNAVFFLLLLYLLRVERFQETVNYIALAIIISVSIQVILALMGVNKETQYIVTKRTVLWFNNPNQLGYFVLLALTFYTVLPSKFRLERIYNLLMIIMCFYLAIISSSRVIIIGLVILSSLLIFSSEKNVPQKRWLVILPAIFLIGTGVFYTPFVQKRINLIETRIERNDAKGVSEAQIRGYDRVFNHPEKILYGAGEGNYDRFNSYQPGEIHSGFGNILFSYGIVGLVFFSLFVFASIRKNLLYNCLLLLPILLYNLVHQGFRATFFWGILAAIFMGDTFKRRNAGKRVG